jgi:hypothetical protein
MKFLLLALFPLFVHAKGLDSCLRIVNQNEKNLCMAAYSGSALFCDRITSYEKRQECMRVVIRKQREWNK